MFKSSKVYRHILYLPACLLLFFVSNLTQQANGEVQKDLDEMKKAANIAHLEDYESEEYVSSMTKTIGNKINQSYEASGDWAVLGFLVTNNGKIPEAWVCSSSGNEKLDEAAVQHLRQTKLHALDEGSPAVVKMFYSPNIHHSHKPAAGSPAGAGKNSTRASEKVADSKGSEGDLQELDKLFKDPSLANVKALVAICANCIFIVGLLLLSGTYQVIAGFFLAGIYWWAHRIFLGQFPS